ncbi:MAG: tRNA (guanosine-2'-O-)-methyltransferase [Saprospiraceae bacterium]|jgi:tRNA (guanosine-2'-O-)-methyltransferase
MAIDLSLITEARAEKLKTLAANRQQDLTVILENIYDPHNLGAVLRTCDSVGIAEVYALYTIESPDELKKISGHKSSSGSKKWVDVHVFDNAEACFNAVRKKYNKIYGTHLGADSVGLYDLELDKSVALLFGNEHRGMSEEALALVDGNFIIPQSGLTKSLNISVACAVSLYEAKRQRINAGMYGQSFDESNPHHSELFERYVINSRPLKPSES